MGACPLNIHLPNINVCISNKRTFHQIITAFLLHIFPLIPCYVPAVFLQFVAAVFVCTLFPPSYMLASLTNQTN
jgi:hypothetical protein